MHRPNPEQQHLCTVSAGKNQADVAKVLDAPWRAQRVIPVIVSRAGRLSRPVDERESSCATRIVHDLRSEDQVWRYDSAAQYSEEPRLA